MLGHQLGWQSLFVHNFAPATAALALASALAHSFHRCSSGSVKPLFARCCSWSSSPNSRSARWSALDRAHALSCVQFGPSNVSVCLSPGTLSPLENY
jgi:hypothetical protein